MFSVRYVRSAYAYMSKDYEEYLLSFYDETYIPDNVVDAGRAAYVCIFYYNEYYEPPQKPMATKTVSTVGSSSLSVFWI